MAVLTMAVPGTASAHAYLVDPPGREGSLSPGPCGAPDEQAPRTVYEPGQSITVQWTQAIPHGGSYRLAFSPNDDAGFDEYVLAELPEDSSLVDYQQDVTLPQCECDDCTVQLWQIVGDSGYYACADIELRAAVPGSVDPCPLVEVPGDPAAGETDGGGSSGGEPEDPGDGSTSGDGSTGGGSDSGDDVDPDAGTGTGGVASGDEAPAGDDAVGSGGCRAIPSTPSGPAVLVLFGLLGLSSRGRRRSATR